MEAPRVSRFGFGCAHPTNLLHAVVQLVAVAFRIKGIHMPIGTRHITPHPIDWDAFALKKINAV